MEFLNSVVRVRLLLNKPSFLNDSTKLLNLRQKNTRNSKSYGYSIAFKKERLIKVNYPYCALITLISTRRFSARPALVLLVAIGALSPMPKVSMRSPLMPLPVK